MRFTPILRCRVPRRTSRVYRAARSDRQARPDGRRSNRQPRRLSSTPGSAVSTAAEVKRHCGRSRELSLAWGRNRGQKGGREEEGVSEGNTTNAVSEDRMAYDIRDERFLPFKRFQPGRPGAKCRVSQCSACSREGAACAPAAGRTGPVAGAAASLPAGLRGRTSTGGAC
jgi:hypothetical protein